MVRKLLLVTAAVNGASVKETIAHGLLSTVTVCVVAPDTVPLLSTMHMSPNGPVPERCEMPPVGVTLAVPSSGI